MTEAEKVAVLALVAQEQAISKRADGRIRKVERDRAERCLGIMGVNTDPRFRYLIFEEEEVKNEA